MLNRILLAGGLGAWGVCLASSCGGGLTKSATDGNAGSGENAGGGAGVQVNTGAGGATYLGGPPGQGGRTGMGGSAENNTGQGGRASGGDAAPNGGAAGVTAGTSGSSGTAGTGMNAGGGGAGGGGISGPSVCDGNGTRFLAPGDGKVDDFEGSMISPGWSSFSDVTPTPNFFKITQEAGGALGTGHFGHYMGTGARIVAKGGYGVGIVYNVAIDTQAGIYCIDISAFDGVTMWAKASKAGSKINVNFVLPETNEHNDVFGGGDCVRDTGCFIHPYKTVVLTTDWAQYSVAFADAGMGMLPGGGAAIVKNRLQELVWISPDPDWDFSLDEIQFYKGAPPTGPVAH